MHYSVFVHQEPLVEAERHYVLASADALLC